MAKPKGFWQDIKESFYLLLYVTEEVAKAVVPGQDYETESLDLPSLDFLSGPSIDNQVKDGISPEQILKEKFEKFKTLKELEDNLAVLKKQKTITDTDIKNATDWLNTPNAATIRDEINAENGTNYSLTDFRSSLPKFKAAQTIQQKSIEQAAFVLKQAKEDNKAALRMLEQDLEKVKKERDLASFQFRQGLIDETALRAAEQNVINIEIDKKKIKDDGELAFAAAGKPGKPGTYKFKADVKTTATSGGFTKTQVEKLLSTSGPGATATGAPGATATGATGATATSGGFTKTQVEKLLSTSGPGATATGATATGATATGTTAPQPKIVVTKAEVDKKLVELGLEDTPANRKTARQELKTGTTAAPGAVDTSWEPLFKQNYPQYSWMFTDLDRTKYADVFSLFFEAINPKTGEQAMEDVEFDRRWKGTSFYRELETSKKGRELSAAIGNFSWGSGQLAKFLTKATQFGYEGENLKQQAYTELFRKVDNKYVNDLAVKEVRASSPYLALKRIGTQYLTALNDETVETALVGGKTADDLLRTSRELTKAMYPHLKDSIDAGVTLEDLAANYKQVAARTLELDPSQVDMGLKFNEALNYTKDGKSRMLSLGEWETELRTNDKYGYKFTKQANQDATDIGLAIARAFGKVQ